MRILPIAAWDLFFVDGHMFNRAVMRFEVQQ